MTGQVTYRTLVGVETEALFPALQKLGWSIPHPELATAQVAEVDGTIVGFAIMQLVMHAEPLYVLPEYRGTGIAEELADQVRETLQGSGAKGWVVVAQNEYAEKLAQRVGMTAVPGKLYRKAG